MKYNKKKEASDETGGNVRKLQLYMILFILHVSYIMYR